MASSCSNLYRPPLAIGLAIAIPRGRGKGAEEREELMGMI
jgi:hypothetical protein